MGWRFFERSIGVPPDIAAITAFSFGHQARFDALQIALPSITGQNRKHAATKRTDGSLLFSGIGAWTADGNAVRGRRGETLTKEDGRATRSDVGVSHLTSGVAVAIETVVALRQTWL